MSAKQAAEALLELDTVIAQFAQPADGSEVERRQSVKAFIRNSVMGTWTLTLAARSAGVTEKQVVKMLLRLRPLRVGTTKSRSDDLAELFPEQ